MAMNRLRHAYLEMRPGLEPNFVSSPYDDLPGALRTVGIEPWGIRRFGSLFYSLVTLPGMLAVIVAAVAAAIGGLAAVGFGAPIELVLAAGATAFVIALVLLNTWGGGFVGNLTPSLEPRFPTPKK